MPGESDQTKWVGIRPTDPAVAIPVTESTPLTNILTQKKAPAVADISAISGFYRKYELKSDVGAGNYTLTLYTVPATKIFIYQYVAVTALQDDVTSIMFGIYSTPTDFWWAQETYGTANVVLRKWPNILLDSNERITIRWNGCIATTDVQYWLMGYLMNKY